MSGWERSAISIATFLPLLGAIVIAFVPRDKERVVRSLGILFSGAALAVALAIAIGFDYGSAGRLQFELDTRWIPVIGARYHVGIDGISLPLYVLTFLLSFLCAVYVAVRPRARQDQGLPRAPAPARDRHGRHVHRVRP